jgi:thioredoxin-like negative regulator of GroEL
MAGKSVIVQINTQENPGLSTRFNITGVPTVLALKGGKATDSVSGAMERHKFMAWWESQIA